MQAEQGDMPPIYPGGEWTKRSVTYAKVYQDINEDRRLTKVDYETLGERMAREQQQERPE